MNIIHWLGRTRKAQRFLQVGILAAVLTTGCQTVPPKPHPAAGGPGQGEAYHYPLVPGTPEWINATVDARLESVDIPQSWLATATSWQIFLSAVKNPYFVSILAGEDLEGSYTAEMHDGNLSILKYVEASPDFGANAMYYLMNLDMPTLWASDCSSDCAAPCWMDYTLVCYMAGRDSALKTMDRASIQRLFNMAVWDADDRLSHSARSPAVAAIRLMYAIYNKPESFRGAFPAGVALPVLSEEESGDLDREIVPENVPQAVHSVRIALGLTGRK